ncbi:MAG: TIGR02266 family protein [Deltaproteobacteria bacterium]|nr:TIGR02266 family protein [Deltaproteobacteria bacterium]
MSDEKRKDDAGLDSGSAKEPDKRKHLRNYLLVLRVKGGDEGKTFFGYARNISKGGMFIASVNPKNVGEEFTVEFTLPKEERPIRCRCVVVWCRSYKPKSPYEPGMGIKFLDLDGETSSYIDRWVKG